VEACRSERPAIVVADLDDPRLPALAAIRSLRADATLADLPIVGFISHVDRAGARAGAEAGCTRVVARGAFVSELHRIVAGGA
jgi:chemosensory pili system protein ChpA (sensor histidine kinase/response regulator)